MSVTLNRRTKTVTLLQGEDDERLQALRERAADLRARADRLAKLKRTPLLSDEDDADTAAREAMQAEQEADVFAADAEPRGVRIVLQALSRRRWPELLEKHPPRDDDDADKRAGANLKTIPEDLIPESIVAPEMTDGERADFLADLSFGQWDYLALEAWGLNTTAGADPKARLGSSPTLT